jgi:hypothetical protein
VTDLQRDIGSREARLDETKDREGDFWIIGRDPGAVAQTVVHVATTAAGHWQTDREEALGALTGPNFVLQYRKALLDQERDPAAWSSSLACSVLSRVRPRLKPTRGREHSTVRFSWRVRTAVLRSAGTLERLGNGFARPAQVRRSRT